MRMIYMYMVVVDPIHELVYDFDLEHWGVEPLSGEPLIEYLLRVAQSSFMKENDNACYSLTFQGAYADNKRWKTYPDTYYLSYITEQTFPDLLSQYYYPTLAMNPALQLAAVHIGTKEFALPPIPVPDFRSSDWWENDGLVSTYSQKYPHTNGTHPVGDEFTDKTPTAHFKPGKWYYQWERNMDHLDICLSPEPGRWNDRKNSMPHCLTGWPSCDQQLPAVYGCCTIAEYRRCKGEKTLMSARAIANNDMVYLQWTTAAKIPNCLGFSVHRVNLETNTERPLSTWVGFEATANVHHERRNSDVWPIQKFQWKDVTARRGGRYTYRIIPMLGTPTALTPAGDLAQETNEVRLAPTHGSISVYFNRGIISTQAIADLLPKKPDGTPDEEALRRLIQQPDGEVRERLAGDLDEALPSLLQRARTKGASASARSTS